MYSALLDAEPLTHRSLNLKDIFLLCLTAENGVQPDEGFLLSVG